VQAQQIAPDLVTRLELNYVPANRFKPPRYVASENL
jgi:hypothetical protein